MLRSFLSALCLLGLLTAEAPAQTPKGGKVTLVIRLPAEAELSIGSQKMALTGAERRFESPALEPGDYAYELTVTWKKEGAEVRQSKTVTCKPGQTVAVEFKAQAESPKLAESPKVADTPKVTETKSPAIEPAKSKTAEAKTRTFQFTYAGKVTELKPGQSARVWLPLPQSNPEQIVVIQQTKVPGDFQIDKDRTYGNQILHFTGKANEKGEIPFEIVVKAARKEVKTDVQANLTVKPSEDPSLLDRFLKPDALVPTSGKSLELIKDQKLPADQFQAAKVLYDVVNNHMKYSKEGKGWGRGDSEWACDSKFGNCTDFHSLFISMARGNKIPSKFEMGFPIPDKHGEGEIKGYHCWAWFMPEKKGWVPVDISEANRNPDLKAYYFGNLSENRIQFTTGRDIDLMPKQSGSPLNFFVYPYVEVENAAYPAEKVQRSFSFKDL